MRSRLGCYRFFVDSGTHFESFLITFGPTKNIFSYLFLVIFGPEFGCPGLQKQAFGIEGIAKINFRRNWISYDLRVDFS